MAGAFPLVGIIVADQREAHKESSPQDRYTRHEVAAPRAVVRLSNPIQSLPQIPHNILNILNPN